MNQAKSISPNYTQISQWLNQAKKLHSQIKAIVSNRNPQQKLIK